jgi:glycogen(starch) synthase
MRIALVSREVHPFVGGGIGAFVAAAARLLSRIGDVTIVTTSSFRNQYERLAAQRDPRLPPAGVRVAFVEEPSAEQANGFYDLVQCYSARVLERLRELYPDGAPDVIEFADYHGEAFVTLQAAHALDRFLEHACICVRLHTTHELCQLLNGCYPRDLRSQAQFEMERFSLSRADRLIHQGGDILGTYGRYYGAGKLAQAVLIRYPYAGAAVAADIDSTYSPSSPLRLLYAGRLERRKGIQNLVSALRGSAREDFRLTIVGSDTPTGPLGTSMRELLRLAIAEDQRIELGEALDRESLSAVIRAHDAVVVPSLWECWPYAALEALHLNRPVLGTPVGGLVELVRPGVSGWLARGTGSAELEAAVHNLLDRSGQLEDLIRSAAPLAHARALSDDQRILDAYGRLASVKPRRRARTRRPDPEQPLVSAIVPYHGASRYVADTISSLLAQTYPRLEIVLVNDGSFTDDDWVVAELAAHAPITVVSQMNQGLGAARNFGVSQSRGRYVFPLDADNLAAPEFVARCVEILERRPELAYLTAWSRYIDQHGRPQAGPTLGYQPLGNQAALIERENVAGDAAAVIPRRIFELGFRYSEELTSYEDWYLYRELHHSGRYGAVIPERLLRYRVHDQSLHALVAQPRRAWLEEEMRALLRENEVRWKSSSV